MLPLRRIGHPFGPSGEDAELVAQVGAVGVGQGRLAKSAPDWLNRGVLTHRSGDTVYPIIDSTVGLAWIAQQAALEVHVPQWRFGADGAPGPATRLVFDLDPGESVTMTQLCEVAHAVRELVDDIGKTALHVAASTGVLAFDCSVRRSRRS